MRQANRRCELKKAMRFFENDVASGNAVRKREEEKEMEAKSIYIGTSRT